jgi:hypothetical protein
VLKNVFLSYLLHRKIEFSSCSATDLEREKEKGESWVLKIRGFVGTSAGQREGLAMEKDIS